MNKVLVILRTHDNKFCCLGVLCDIYSKEKGVPWKGSAFLDKPYHMGGTRFYLPIEVRQWADISGPELMHVESLSGLNDNGVSFTEIAKVIKQSEKY